MERNLYIEAGKIVATHGVAGEVKAEVWLDSVAFLKKFKRVFIRGIEFETVSVRSQKGFALMRLSGIDDVNSAMNLKGAVFSVSRDDVHLPEGTFFLCDIMGAKVVDEAGNQIGILEDIIENPAHPVLVVNGERERLIPYVPEFVLSADADAGVITVRLIEGM